MNMHRISTILYAEFAAPRRFLTPGRGEDDDASHTIEEDEVDERRGDLLSAQKVEVLHAEVERESDDRVGRQVRGDVRHQREVLHEAARLRRTQRRASHGGAPHTALTTRAQLGILTQLEVIYG